MRVFTIFTCISFVQCFRQNVSVHINGIRVIPYCESSILNSTEDIACITPCQSMYHGSKFNNLFFFPKSFHRGDVEISVLVNESNFSVIGKSFLIQSNF